MNSTISDDVAEFSALLDQFDHTPAQREALLEEFSRLTAEEKALLFENTALLDPVTKTEPQRCALVKEAAKPIFLELMQLHCYAGWCTGNYYQFKPEDAEFEGGGKNKAYKISGETLFRVYCRKSRSTE